jgi:hypothetical protein
MLRKALPALVSVAALTSAQVHAENKLILKSVNVDLPFGDRMFPDGPGLDVVNGNCLACPPMQWRTEVEKMRTAYKAPIDAKDIDTIVNYLVALQPAK